MIFVAFATIILQLSSRVNLFFYFSFFTFQLLQHIYQITEKNTSAHFFAQCKALRTHAFEQGIKCRRMIMVYRMAQLMQNNIVNHFRSIHNQISGKIQTVFSGAGAESCPGAGYTNSGKTKSVLFRKKSGTRPDIRSRKLLQKRFGGLFHIFRMETPCISGKRKIIVRNADGIPYTEIRKRSFL